MRQERIGAKGVSEGERGVGRSASDAIIHSSFMRPGRGFFMARSFLFSLACVVFAASRALAAEAAAAAVRPVCLNGSETREEIAAHRLLQPFAVLKSAAAIAKAEALSAKLCKLGDDFVYEIALLHHDGRLVHLVMNATTGKVINARNSREA